jgi:hypothetical protein
MQFLQRKKGTAVDDVRAVRAMTGILCKRCARLIVSIKLLNLFDTLDFEI